ncbi:MAG TPA: hypothetical protein VM662_06800 [Sphingomonas sp.]|nr:hypothetical protein [Sphingomonas sp.]
MSDKRGGPLETGLAEPKPTPFRNKHSTPRLSPAALERQSRVKLLAWNLLGPDSAIAFLNAYNEALGGRAVDVAVASADGCAAVERAISARAGVD